MAETNDPNAHLTSLNLYPNSITMLDGRRYHQRHKFESNQWYQIPVSIWNQIKDDPSDKEYTINGNTYNMVDVLKWYLRHHFVHELPRILTLERYYRADDDIHYWRSDKIRRADNRISSAFARYITNFKDGLLLGKSLKYGYENHANENDDGQNLLDQIKNFNQFTDERHHDSQIGKDCLVTGRGYELTYIPENTTTPKVARIDPSNCFIIWSSDVDSKELCAVYYRMVRVAYNYNYQITVYTDDKIYTFNADQDAGGEWTLLNTEDNQFNDVPITEYSLNDEREGSFEPVLDIIDSYDKSISEMENSEEDFSNATLVIAGAVKRPSDLVQLVDQRGRKLYYEQGYYQDLHHITTHQMTSKGKPNRPVMVRRHIDTKSNVMWLIPSTDEQGDVKSQPSASYLTKQLNVSDWNTHLQVLVNDIQQFTGIPDISDNSRSSSNQTELETETKLMGSLENASDFESNFRHGIIRRLKLLAGYWDALPNNGFTSNETTNDPTDVTVHFDINLPLNVQDVIQKIQEMTASGDVSKQSVLEQMQKLDGVPANEEITRMKSQNAEQQSQNASQMNANFQNEANAASIGIPNASNNANSDSHVDSSASSANNSVPNSSQSLQNDNSELESGSATNFSQTSSEVKQSSANSTGNSMINSYLAETANDPSMADNDIRYMNEYIDSNGSTVSFDNPRADNMLPGMFLIDSLYGKQMGFPSGWDSVMSSFTSTAFSGSIASALSQSAVDLGNSMANASNTSDDYDQFINSPDNSNSSSD